METPSWLRDTMDNELVFQPSDFYPLQSEVPMYEIDLAGFVTLMSYMLVRLAVPVLLMALMSKGLRLIVPQTP